MDVAELFFIVAVIIFAVDAWLRKSLQSVGLAFFAAAFVVKALL